MSRPSRAGQILENATSFRLFLGMLFAGALIGALLSVIWHPLLYVGLAIGFLAWLGNVLSADQVLYCPFCRKRVKMSADTCHHCGQVVTQPSSET